MSGFIQLWHASFHLVNLPATLLLILVLVYWATVLLGVLDLGSLDMDAPDADASAGGADGDASHGLLEYFNIRRVPASIVISAFALSAWMLGVLANHYIHGTQSKMLGLAILLPNIIVSAHVAKFVTLPLAPLFRSMRADAAETRNLVGVRVVVTSSQADTHFGQAEIRESGAPIALMVRTDGEVLPKGAEAVIVEADQETGIHIITKLEV